MRNTHRPGRNLVVCDECGLTYYDDQVRKRWDGAIVCLGDWEPRHPQDYVHTKRTSPSPAIIRPDRVTYTVNNTAPSTVGNTGVSAKPGPATHLFP